MISSTSPFQVTPSTFEGESTGVNNHRKCRGIGWEFEEDEKGNI
jgi:hypothetical protein